MYLFVWKQNWNSKNKSTSTTSSVCLEKFQTYFIFFFIKNCKPSSQPKFFWKNCILAVGCSSAILLEKRNLKKKKHVPVIARGWLEPLGLSTVRPSQVCWAMPASLVWCNAHRMAQVFSFFISARSFSHCPLQCIVYFLTF